MLVATGRKPVKIRETTIECPQGTTQNSFPSKITFLLETKIILRFLKPPCRFGVLTPYLLHEAHYRHNPHAGPPDKDETPQRLLADRLLLIIDDRLDQRRLERVRRVVRPVDRIQARCVWPDSAVGQAGGRPAENPPGLYARSWTKTGQWPACRRWKSSAENMVSEFVPLPI